MVSQFRNHLKVKSVKTIDPASLPEFSNLAVNHYQKEKQKLVNESSIISIIKKPGSCFHNQWRQLLLKIQKM